MSSVRVLVGTRKGAFVLTSDGKREKWDVSGPHFAGWEIYHVKGSPVDSNRLYASQSSGWFGQLIQRSDDGGTTWTPVGNKFVYDGVPGTHQWYDTAPHPWEFKRVWHLEPSTTDPDVVYAGAEDAAHFSARDRLAPRPGRNCPVCGQCHGSGRAGSPPVACACTRSMDPSDPDRILSPLSARFPTDDGAKTWKAINQGLRSEHILIRPPRSVIASIAAMHRSRPRCCSCKSTGTHAPITRAIPGKRSRQPAHDFGFVIDVHAHEPETIYVVPHQERFGALPA